MSNNIPEMPAESAGKKQQITLTSGIPFEFAGKLPLVTVKADGASKRFILDNGSPAMVINSKHDNTGGTPLQAFFASGGTQNIQSKFVAAFEWEDLHLVNQLALIMDLSHLEREANTTIHGVIGASMIMKRDLMLNYCNKQASLLNLPDSPANLMESVAPALIGKYQTIPLQMAHHFPFIRVRIGEKVLNMALNMGACINTINQTHMEHLKQLGLLTGESPDKILGLTTEKQVSAYSIKSAIISTSGDIPLDSMKFAFDNIDIPGAAIDGMLGYELFSRIAAVIRYNRREFLCSMR